MNFERETIPNKDFSLESENLDVGIGLVDDLESRGGEWKDGITHKSWWNGSKSYSIHIFS